MPTTTSFPTANDSGGQADNWHADDGTTGRLRQGQTPVGADSYISLNPDRNVKLRDALEFNPDIPDVRFAQGGIVSLRRH